MGKVGKGIKESQNNEENCQMTYKSIAELEINGNI